MDSNDISEIINLCNLAILKTVAIKERLYSNKQLGNDDTQFLVSIYCRELLIIIREIELTNQFNNLR